MQQLCLYEDHKANNEQTLENAGLPLQPAGLQPEAAERGYWPVVKKDDWCGHFETKLPDRRAAGFEQTPAKPASSPDISLARQHSPARPVDIQPTRKHASHAQISTASQPAFHRQPARYTKPPEGPLRRFLYGMRLRAIRDIQISRGGSPFG